MPVQVLRVVPVLGRLVGVRLAPADGPAVRAVPALVPPAVEDRAVDDAVHGRLHAARAGCLERPARVVEPDVHALHEVARDAHVVVLEDEDAAREARRAAALEDVLDHPLAGAVGRVGLAREHDLDRAVGVPEQARQALLVAEEQRGSLVGREPAREADGQDVRVEDAVDSASSASGDSPWRANWRAAGRGRRYASSSFCCWWASQMSRRGCSSRRSQKRLSGSRRSWRRGRRRAPAKSSRHRPAQPGRRRGRRW